MGARLMSPTASYEQFVSMGIIRRDDRQVAALAHVERVYDDVVKFYNSPHARQARQIAPPPPNRLGFTPISILQKQIQRDFKETTGLKETFHPLSNVKGLYLYGGVGCGKSYLMDILYNELPTTRKQRVHFHQFMLEVHKAMHHIRSQKRTKDAEVDAIDEVAMRLIANAEVLCFDEMVVSDIGDAMILRRLFHSFYRIGVVSVFTSNRAPDDLYKGGINRESFLPFIRMLKDRCVVIDIDSDTDYRLTGEAAKTFLFPITPENEAKFHSQFLALTKGLVSKEERLRVFGRDVVVPRAVGGVCRFTFAELCGSELGTADYSVIAKKYHTVFLEHVPTFSPSATDTKRRFIMLLDTLYQHKVKLVVLADAGPAELEQSNHHVGSLSSKEAMLLTGSGNAEFGLVIDTGEDSFQMQRATSRLMEMSSVGYLQSKHEAGDYGLHMES